ncbi:antibiotic biosynthesis monooxygenase [Microbacterium sp. NPDC016588]
MIVRVSEAHVRDGLADEFLALLRKLVASFPEQHDGLLRHEVLATPPT